MELTRFTTEYIDFEDRFRLTAETDGGERVHITQSHQNVRLSFKGVAGDAVF